jgi:hypothetical protein
MTLQRLKQEWQKSPDSSPKTRQRDGKNLVWFGEIEIKLAQIINAYLYLPFFLLIILLVMGTNELKQSMMREKIFVLS